MSSKVLTGAARAVAQQIEWRRVPVLSATPAVTNNLYAEQGRGDQSEVSTEELRREAEIRAEAAYQRGFREGEAAGSASAAARMDAAVERLAQSVKELAGWRGRMRQQAETDIIKLAVAMARRILRREVSVDPEVLVGIAKAALEKLSTMEACRLRVNPAHAPALANYFKSSGTRVEVVSDLSLEPGAAVFESSGGSLDAGVESQLSEIERGITDLCRR